MVNKIAMKIGFYLTASASLFLSTTSTDTEANKACNTSTCPMTVGYERTIEQNIFWGESLSRASFFMPSQQAKKFVEVSNSTRKIPGKPSRKRINNIESTVYEFSPENIGIDFIVEQPPESLGHFIAEARQKYGDRLEFITTAHFYDIKTGQLIGAVIDRGQLTEAERKPTKKRHRRSAFSFYYDTSLVYDGSQIAINNNGRHYIKNAIEQTDKRAACGFLELLRDGKSLTRYNPDISPYKRAERSALGIKKNGNVVLLFSNTTIPELQGQLKKLKADDAIYLDSGNSQAFYADGKTYLRKNPNRRLVDVIVGYRK